MKYYKLYIECATREIAERIQECVDRVYYDDEVYWKTITKVENQREEEMDNDKTKREKTLKLFRLYISKYVSRYIEDYKAGRRERFDDEELSQLLIDAVRLYNLVL